MISLSKRESMLEEENLKNVYSIQDLKNLQKMGVSKDTLRKAYKMIEGNNHRRRQATEEFSSLDYETVSLHKVQELLNNGADVNVRSKKNGLPVLMELCLIGKEKRRNQIISLLIHKGANVNIEGENGNTVLKLLHHLEDRELIEEALKKLKEQGHINKKNKYGDTYLHQVVGNGEDYSVRFLINEGVQIDVKNNDGETPFVKAVLNNRMRVASLLIDKGADVNAKDKYGTPMIMHIYDLQNEGLFQKMIDNGADINLQKADGENLLMIATREKDEKTIRFLIQKGADLNVKNTYGESVLMIAFNGGKEYEEIMNLFIQNGAQDTKVNKIINKERFKKAQEILSVDKDKKGKEVDHSLRRALFGGEFKKKNAPLKISKKEIGISITKEPFGKNQKGEKVLKVILGLLKNNQYIK